MRYAWIVLILLLFSHESRGRYFFDNRDSFFCAFLGAGLLLTWWLYPSIKALCKYHGLVDKDRDKKILEADSIEPLSTIRSDNKIDKDGNTKLLRACSSWQVNPDEVALLLDRGASVNVVNNNGDTPLLKVCCRSDASCKVVTLLLNKGANVNVVNNYGETPLLMECSKGTFDGVALLLDRDANVNVRDKDGNTPLIIACSRGDIAIITLLLHKHAEIEAVNNRGDSPLRVAYSKGHKDIVTLLLQSGANVNVVVNNKGDTPLIMACSWGDLALITLLLDTGADVNIANTDGDTPLLHAMTFGGNSDIVTLLLDRGANINVVDKKGGTPLRQACCWGNSDIITLLLDRGANIESVDQHGDTPLLIACELGHLNIINLLLDRGANINVVNKNKHTPLSYAVLYSIEAGNMILNSIPDKDLNDHLGAILENDETVFYQIRKCGNEHICSTIVQRYSDKERSQFLNRQLYYVASVYSELKTNDCLKNFIVTCVELGGDCNKRDGKSGLRPVDVTFQRYQRAPRVRWVQTVHHMFLKETPCMSDEYLYVNVLSQLKSDCARYILGYYYALTLERRVAEDKSSTGWDAYEQHSFKKNLLINKLQKIGMPLLCNDLVNRIRTYKG